MKGASKALFSLSINVLSVNGGDPGVVPGSWSGRRRVLALVLFGVLLAGWRPAAQAASLEQDPAAPGVRHGVVGGGVEAQAALLEQDPAARGQSGTGGRMPDSAHQEQDPAAWRRAETWAVRWRAAPGGQPLPGAGAEPDAEADAEPDGQPPPGVGAEPGTEQDGQTPPDAEVAPDAEQGGQPLPDAGAEPDAEPDGQPLPDAEAAPDAEQDGQTPPDAEAAPDAEPDGQPLPDAGAEPGTEPDVQTPPDDPGHSREEALRAAYAELQEKRRLLQGRLHRLRHQLAGRQLPVARAQAIRERMAAAFKLLHNPLQLGAFRDQQQLRGELRRVDYNDARLQEVEQWLREEQG